MAKKDTNDYSEYLPDQENSEIVPAVEPDLVVFDQAEDFVYDFSDDLDPIEIGAATQQYGIGFPMLKAKDTQDRRVIVRRLRRVHSTKQAGKYYYFCNCEFQDTGERFNCAYGGQSLIDMFEALIAGGNRQPISFIPRYKTGGRFGNYWTAE